MNVLAAHGPAEGLPEVGLQAADAHPAAVRGLVDVVEGRGAVEEALAGLGTDAAREVLADHPRQEVHDAVGHGDVHVLAPARPLAGDEGRQDAERRMQAAAGEVGDDVQGDGRRLARPADHAQRAADGDVVDVVAHQAGVGAVLPVAGERAVDQARVDAAQRLVVHAQALHHAGAEALQHHVRRLRQPVEDVARLLASG